MEKTSEIVMAADDYSAKLGKRTTLSLDLDSCFDLVVNLWTMEADCYIFALQMNFSLQALTLNIKTYTVSLGDNQI